MRTLSFIVSLGLGLAAGTAQTGTAQDGVFLYKQRCAQCHDSPVGRVPPVSALRAMDSAAILRAMDTGIMKTQAAGLTSEERNALAAYLAASAKAAPASQVVTCQGDDNQQVNNAARWTNWGVDSQNTRFQEATAAGLTATSVPRLKLKWAFALGKGTNVRSQPAVANGRVFTAGLAGSLYALNARSGCQYWEFKAAAPIRSGIAFGAAGVANPSLYFGDVAGNAYSVDTVTGQLVWKVHVDDYFAAIVTGTPQVHQGVVFVPVASYEEILPPNPKYECCKFRGSVVALDGQTGKLIWKTYTIQETPKPTKKSKAGTQLYGPSGAGIWSSPTIDEKADILYVATGDNYSEPATKSSDAVLAPDAKTGAILWSKQVTPNDIYNDDCSMPDKNSCPESRLVSAKVGRWVASNGAQPPTAKKRMWRFPIFASCQLPIRRCPKATG